MFCAFLIWLMAYSHDNQNTRVANSIAVQWGTKVNISGPTFCKAGNDAILQRPATFDCDAAIKVKPLHRNIYEAEVFDADVNIRGTVLRENLEYFGDSLSIRVNLPVEQIPTLRELTLNDEKIEWNRSEDMISANFLLENMPDTIGFSFAFNIHGSGAFYVNEIGMKSLINISGDASNPSFRGFRLPDERQTDKHHFRALWKSTCSECLYSPVYEDTSYYESSRERYNDYSYDSTYYDKEVGMKFLVGVDRYQKVSRSMKYAFLIILLTYTSVLFAEITTKREIPLLNYFLIGAALVLFYSLLLSFSEFTTFGWSYLTAAVMTVGLITGYMWKMLMSAKVGLTIFCVLTVIYTCCYILLTLSTYALLLGSLVLFVVLALMMYVSLLLRRE